MSKTKAVGRRGSWFAEVNGESLPCVHEYWVRQGCYYHDPNAVPGERKWDELIAAIQTKKRVILTKDKVYDGGNRFERSGYVAVFEVDDLEIDGRNLRFRLTRRLVELG